MDILLVIIILASLVLLVIGLFSPRTSLFWYNQERTRNKSAKIYGITFIVSFILVGIITDKDESNDNSSSNEPTEVVTERKWTEVYTFKGNGMKKSPTFELTGGEARLKYNYSSNNPMGGMFSAYVVDEGKDLMKEGGIAEVMSTEKKEESESSIHKNAGRYYLSINALGKWVVTVEELK